MPQRALLFSSEPETSRRLAHALRELEFSVDHCPEIFAAVERITSHSFELIVSDWDDGVEAMFLIKTARELRLNSDAFRIVVAKPAASAAAMQSGAQLVLPKPVLPGHTKYALLTSDEFTRRKKNWLPAMAEPISPALPKPAAPGLPASPQAVLPAPPSAFTEPWPHPTPEPDDVGGLNPGLGGLEHPADFFQGLGVESDSVYTKIKPRLRILAFGTLLAAGLSAGYLMSTFKAQASSPSVVPSAERLSQSAGAATAPALPLQRAISKLTIQVTPGPSRPAPAPQPAIAEPQEDAPAATADPTKEVVEAVAAPPPSVRPSIPASLSVPLQADLGAKTPTTKPSASLLSAVEPVSLAEDLAEKMLLQRVAPDYPAQALQSKLQGVVLLQAWIRKDGTIRDLEVIRGPLVLCQAAYSAVKQWRYKPFQVNGQSVEAKTLVTVNFQLPLDSRP